MKKIPLSGPKGLGQYALVDDEDFAAVSIYSWNLTPNGYAATKTSRRKDNKVLFLHRLILGDPPPDLLVDHVDGNGLNNQRANLRFATTTQNAYNRGPHRNSTSSFKGVFWNKSKQFWIAQIGFNKKNIHLGYFMSELDAARAYNEAAAQYFGEHARLNVIPDDADEPIHYRQAVPRANSRTSRYRGVSLSTGEKRWVAKIGVAGKNIHLGFFDTAEDAAHAYDTAAKLHHGNLAYLNFPD